MPLKVEPASSSRFSGNRMPILENAPQTEFRIDLRPILAIAILIFVVDVFVRINLSPINYLLLAAAAWMAPRRSLWPLTCFLSALAMATPFLKHFTLHIDWWLVYIGIINRALLVGGLCIITALLHDFRRPRRSYGSIRSNDDIDATLSLGVLAVALIFVTLVAGFDFFLPAYINPSTLYAVPVLLVAFAGDRRSLIWAIAVLMVLLVVGFFSGPRHISPDLLHRAAVGRIVGGIVLIILGLLFRRILGSVPSNPDLADES